MIAHKIETSGTTETDRDSLIGPDCDWERGFISWVNRTPSVYGLRGFKEPKRSWLERREDRKKHGFAGVDPEVPMSDWRIKNLLGIRSDPKYRSTWRMTDSYLERTLRNGNELVAMTFDHKTDFVDVDIDKHSIYNHLCGGDDSPVIEAMAEIGLSSYVAITSSSSNGLHYYFPFPRSCKTFVVAQTVFNHLLKSGIDVSPGQCEVFPNVKAYGSLYKPLRLPLQTGSKILDHEIPPVKDLFSFEKELFMNLMKKAASEQNFETFVHALKRLGFPANNIQPYKSHHQPDGERRCIPKPKLKAERDAEKSESPLRAAIDRLIVGWTGRGQSNELIMTVGFVGRCQYGLRGKDLTNYIIKTAVGLAGYETYASGHSKRLIARGKWAAGVAKYYSRYEFYGMAKAKKETDPEYHDRVSQEARNRISKAVQSISRKTFSSLSAAISAVAEVAQSSVRTVKDCQHLITEKFFILGGKYKSKVKAVLPMNCPRIQDGGEVPQYDFQSFLDLPPCSIDGSYFGNCLNPVTDFFTALGLFESDSQSQNGQTPTDIYGEASFSWLWGLVTQGAPVSIDSG